MGKKRSLILFEVLAGKSRSSSGPAIGRIKSSRAGARPRKGAGSSGGGGVGGKRLHLSLSLNGLLGLVVLLAVLLAGMYGLGRYQAGAGKTGKTASLSSMNMSPGILPTAGRKTSTPPAKGAEARPSRKKPGKTLKGLCVISYAYTPKGKSLAVKMVKWLRSQGLEKTLYASDRGKFWMVVVPYGGVSPKALTRRITALKAPPFAEKRFRFADQKMLSVTLRVNG